MTTLNKLFKISQLNASTQSKIENHKLSITNTSNTESKKIQFWNKNANKTNSDKKKREIMLIWKIQKNLRQKKQSILKFVKPRSDGIKKKINFTRLIIKDQEKLRCNIQNLLLNY